MFLKNKIINLYCIACGVLKSLRYCKLKQVAALFIVLQVYII